MLRVWNVRTSAAESSKTRLALAVTGPYDDALAEKVCFIEDHIKSGRAVISYWDLGLTTLVIPEGRGFQKGNAKSFGHATKVEND
jgi:hypothetical protein